MYTSRIARLPAGCKDSRNTVEVLQELVHERDRQPDNIRIRAFDSLNKPRTPALESHKRRPCRDPLQLATYHAISAEAQPGKKYVRHAQRGQPRARPAGGSRPSAPRAAAPTAGSSSPRRPSSSSRGLPRTAAVDDDDVSAPRTDSGRRMPFAAQPWTQGPRPCRLLPRQRGARMSRGASPARAAVRQHRRRASRRQARRRASRSARRGDADARMRRIANDKIDTRRLLMKALAHADSRCA